MNTREIILSIAVVILLFLYFDKDVEVVEKKVVVHDTIYKKIPKILTLNSKPVKITPISLSNADISQHYVPTKYIKQGDTIKTNLYKYQDSIPNGTITSLIKADTIYDRVVFYNAYETEKYITTTETITKFDSRLYLGVYTNFANTNTNSIFSVSSYTWSESGLELLYARNKMYYGVSAGLTQNRFDYEWARNSTIDGVVGFKLGIKIK